MLHRAKEIKGFRLAARDGEIGRVKDFYFDDIHWVVRYVVADTGTWLPKQLVLLSPYSVERISASDEKHIGINLTREQIERSPSVELDKPVSRQMEEKYFQYYNWPYYWAGPYVWGPFPMPRAMGASMVYDRPGDTRREEYDNPHLRSAEAVAGYRIRALDDDFGQVEDFVFDDESWSIRYLVVDTRSWWPGKKVLLPPQWISSIDWDAACVRIDLDRETVQRAPEYDSGRAISREYEEKLFRFYNRDPYWKARGAAAPVR